MGLKLKNSNTLKINQYRLSILHGFCENGQMGTSPKDCQMTAF